MPVASRSILSNFFGEQGRQNHPQYLSGLSRALFPTTFLETAVYKGRSRGGLSGGVAPPLFLDQSKARRADKFFGETAPLPPSPLYKGLDDRAPWAQLFEGRLALNPGFFFSCSKPFSRIIFSVIFRASNHQLVDKNN